MYPQISTTEILHQTTSVFVHRVQSCEMHRHLATEILWVLSGTLTVLLNDEQIFLGSGDLLGIPANQHHAVLTGSDDNLTLCLQHRFNQPNYLALKPSLTNPVSVARLDSLRARLAHIWWEQKYQPEFWQQAIDANLLTVQLLLLRYFSDVQNTSAITAEVVDENATRTREIIRFLEQNHHETMSLRQVAEKFGLTDSYLSHYFRVKTGTSFLRYLTRLRLEKALSELSQTDKHVAEVALAVGFPSIKAFNIAFKREYGCTPSDFRKRQLSRQLPGPGRHYAAFNSAAAEKLILPWLNKAELFL